jgi:hypothetical protein
VGIDPAVDRPLLELGDGLGVLSRLPIDEDAERVPWDGCFGGFDSGASDCLAMKGFLVTTLTLDDGVEIDLYNLHGEAGGGPEDQALQERDYQQLATYLAQRSAGRAVIVAGDTNLHTDREHPDGGDGGRVPSTSWRCAPETASSSRRSPTASPTRCSWMRPART